MFQCLAGDIFSYILGLWNNNFESFFLQVSNAAYSALIIGDFD